MLLAEALRLAAAPRLALVGAGGKTTALFQLARQLLARPQVRSVLITASTHLSTSQLSLADRHITASTGADLEPLEASLPDGATLVTGPPAEQERTAGLQPALLARLLALAQVHDCPLLVEADGSRRRPLKAPAMHEPAIPAWVQHVVVVAGLSAMGAPLNAELVHRPEYFAALSGLSPDEPITTEALARVLNNVEGGLKNIPVNARRVALLNQADSPALQATAQRLAGLLMGAYHAVLVSSLAPPDQTFPDESQGVLAVHEPVAGIVLAAGGAQRMGKPKQTLPWRGEALVRHTARLALAANLSPVVVVTGFVAEQVQAALHDLPVTCVRNPSWEAGQSTSLIAGLRALPPESGAAIFLLADQPTVSASLVRGLVEAHARTLAPIIAPMVDGQRANPVLFDRKVFPELLALRGDVGGRAIFSRQPVQWLPWHDQAPLFDIDSPEDYQRLLSNGN
jgi:molybdenum cofactor cytidylyltransferase